MPDTPYTILLPASSPQQISNLLPLVVPMALGENAHVIVLHAELFAYGAGFGMRSTASPLR